MTYGDNWDMCLNAALRGALMVTTCLLHCHSVLSTLVSGEKLWSLNVLGYVEPQSDGVFKLKNKQKKSALIRYILETIQIRTALLQ